jgi:hypothetical protein
MAGVDHRCAHDRAAALRQGGFTPAAYRALLDAQGGGCAICRRDQPEPGVGGLRVDHDHATGAVRGLLCAACTIGLAYFHDDPDLLRAALAYLE